MVISIVKDRIDFKRKTISKYSGRRLRRTTARIDLMTDNFAAAGKLGGGLWNRIRTYFESENG